MTAQALPPLETRTTKCLLTNKNSTTEFTIDEAHLSCLEAMAGEGIELETDSYVISYRSVRSKTGPFLVGGEAATTALLALKKVTLYAEGGLDETYDVVPLLEDGSQPRPQREGDWTDEQREAHREQSGSERAELNARTLMFTYHMPDAMLGEIYPESIKMLEAAAHLKSAAERALAAADLHPEDVRFSQARARTPRCHKRKPQHPPCSNHTGENRHGNPTELTAHVPHHATARPEGQERACTNRLDCNEVPETDWYRYSERKRSPCQPRKARNRILLLQTNDGVRGQIKERLPSLLERLPALREGGGWGPSSTH